jgi:hypothetical protein
VLAQLADLLASHAPYDVIGQCHLGVSGRLADLDLLVSTIAKCPPPSRHSLAEHCDSQAMGVSSISCSSQISPRVHRALICIPSFGSDV